MNKKQWLPLWLWGILTVATLITSFGLLVFYRGLESAFGGPNSRPFTVTVGATLVVINLILWSLYARDYRVKKALEKPNGPGVIVPANNQLKQQNKEK